jgi:SnoaL-like domain
MPPGRREVLARWTARGCRDTIDAHPEAPREVSTMTIPMPSRRQALIILIALLTLAVPLTAFGRPTGTTSSRDDVTQREADMYLIDQVEVKFHRATSTHDLALMMSLWAPGAVFNIDQKTLVGKAQIRHWFATENKAFRPNHEWESDTPSYKLKINLTGEKATMYFECHYIDPATAKVMAVAGVSHTLQKIHGTWLITDSAGVNATLSAR